VQAGQPPDEAAAFLSGREQQVLVRLVQGLSMKQVARELGIAPRTVAFHKYKAMENNGLQNNAELMAFALRHRLLPVG
jgi:DNA-binding NarL/FixJ family response regulator